LLPAQTAIWWYLGAMLAVFVSIGILESLVARFRMNRNLELVLVPLSIALLTLAVLIAKNLGAW